MPFKQSSRKKTLLSVEEERKGLCIYGSSALPPKCAVRCQGFKILQNITVCVILHWLFCYVSALWLWLADGLVSCTQV